MASAAYAVKPAPNGKLMRKLWAVGRTYTIWSNVLGHAISVVRLRARVARKGLRGDALVAERRKNAARLRDTLIELGPTFIKIGQLLSTRVDVLAPEVIEELSRLQNEVPSFPAERALAIIKEELGKPADELFDSFDSEPLAAASLAQVHHAVMKGSGEEVVVKVQRENLIDLFHVDLWNIQLVAKIADRFDSQTEAVAANWKDIADTSGKVLFREVDFNVEREACDEFGKNFEKFDAIKIPKTYEAVRDARARSALLIRRTLPRAAEQHTHRTCTRTSPLAELLTSSHPRLRLSSVLDVQSPDDGVRAGRQDHQRRCDGEGRL